MNKNIFKPLILLMSFLMVGSACASISSESSSQLSTTSNRSSSTTSSSQSSRSSQSSSSSRERSSSSSSSATTPSSSSVSSSRQEGDWFYDETGHFHKTGEGESETRTDFAAHNLEIVSYKEASEVSEQLAEQYGIVKVKQCSTCGYFEFVEGKKNDFPLRETIPEFRFSTTDASGTSFATSATKDDLERPEITGTFTMGNCESKYQFADVAGTMKVRGNQTAGWAKKGFRIKFNEKRNLLGLNNEKKFKKWVLFADAKDTALCRTALGLHMSKAICSPDKIWSSDFAPVRVYLNDQYWGYYFLAEQKETKSGRINLEEPSESDKGTDIAYCFELDYYASNENKKTDGDPTFTMTYNPKTVNYTLAQSEGIANYYSHIGVVKTYTMLSTITNETTQLPFIKNKLEQSYRILYETAINNKAMMVNEGGSIVDSTETDLQKNLSNYFDLNSFADGYLINEISCTPDVGYSSFYMAYDNTDTGDKKVKFVNPWDFDSNFGNRSGFITNADDLYLRRCANQWLNLLSKLPFFMDIVKQKWNTLRDNGSLEMSIHMIKEYFNKYDAAYIENFNKWPTNDAAYELRDPFKNTNQYKKAQAETINWLNKRVNYLESQWGNNLHAYLGDSSQSSGGQTQTTDYTKFKSNATKTRLETEDAVLAGGATKKTRTGEDISGGSYVGELGNNPGSTVTFTFNSPKACQALLNVGLSSRTDGDHKLTDFFNISINGDSFSSDAVVARGNGTDYHIWINVDAGMINLKNGQNTIVFTSTNVGTNFDYIDLYLPK